MKFRFIATLIICSFIGYIGYSQTGEEIILKHLEARGGLENYWKINTWGCEGRISTGGQDVPFTIYYKAPKMTRGEVLTQGGTIVLVADSQSAWGINPMQNPKPQDIPRENIVSNFEPFYYFIEGFMTYLEEKEKEGGEFTLVGKDTVEGKEAFKLENKTKDGQIINYWFDATDYMLIKDYIKFNNEGKVIEISNSFKNFRAISGIKIPFKVEKKIGEEIITTTFTKIKANIPLPDSIFQKPKD